MTTLQWEAVLPLYLSVTYLFMVLLTAYLGRKSNLHWGIIALAALLLSPIAGLLLLLISGERMNSYQRMERLKQLREQGLLNNEEFNWKYKPASQLVLRKELGILRYEGVLTYKEYRSKLRRLKEQGDYAFS